VRFENNAGLCHERPTGQTYGQDFIAAAKPTLAFVGRGSRECFRWPYKIERRDSIETQKPDSLWIHIAVILLEE
jgi:hypothetical protein